MIKTVAVVLISCVTWISAAHGRPSDLPDPKLTPGVVRDDLTLEQICKTAWGKDERLVTDKMKKQVIAEYPGECPSGKTEIDHLLSRELGGADDVRNLWKQCYEKPVVDDVASAVASKKAGHAVVVYVPPSMVAEFGAHKKDRLENDYGKRACLPVTDPQHMTLEQARTALSGNWVAAYIERYGDPRAAH